MPSDELVFEVALYFPKKFAALRKFYCGDHIGVVESMMHSAVWIDNSGGKSKALFLKSHDERFIFKEVKESDMRYFRETFYQHYFDYLTKGFFHNYPITLGKILGAFKVTVQNNTHSEKTVKKYFFMMENM